MISIIIPVFNSQEYICRCVNSIKNQTYSNIEIILIDDGSTDESGRICDKLASEDSRINVIHQPNGRAAKARNTGIEAAKGEYLLFVDSDDYIDPEMCEMMRGQFEDDTVSFVECGMNIHWSNGSVSERVSKQQLSLSNVEAMTLFWNNSGIITASFSDKMIRRQIFDAGLRLDSTTGNEDTEVIPRLLDMSNHVVVVNKPLYHYIKRDDSTSMAPKFDLRIYSFIPYMRNYKSLLSDKYIDAYGWYNYYMASTYNGMYKYLLACRDKHSHLGILLTIRYRLIFYSRKARKEKKINEVKKAELTDFLRRGLLGDRMYAFMSRLITHKCCNEEII